MPKAVFNHITDPLVLPAARRFFRPPRLAERRKEACFGCPPERCCHPQKEKLAVIIPDEKPISIGRTVTVLENDAARAFRDGRLDRPRMLAQHKRREG